MKVYYEFSSSSHVTREGDPGDRWDRDSTSTSWSAPDTIYLDNGGRGYGYGYEIDDVPDESLKPGDVIFLVWVQYSTGDSFGHDAGANHEIVGWYRNHRDAYRARDTVEERSKGKYDYGDGGNTVQIPTFDGSATRPQYCGSWLGYFESLDFCRVETVRVAA